MREQPGTPLDPAGANLTLLGRSAHGPLGRIQLAVGNFLQQNLATLRGELTGRARFRQEPQRPQALQPPQAPGMLHLVVALSGGADSLALAAGCLRAVRSPRTRQLWGGPVQLLAMSVDHGWRPEATAEARAAARLAITFGFDQAYSLHPAAVAGNGTAGLNPRETLLIEDAKNGQVTALKLVLPGKLAAGSTAGPQHSARSPHGGPGGAARQSLGGSLGGNSLGPEAGARDWRWWALAAASQYLCPPDPVLLLTAHTQDDQAETVLLGLGRGSGARSLAGMAPLSPLASRFATISAHPVDGAKSTAKDAAKDTPSPGKKPQFWVGKPLLGLTRAHTEEACAQLGVTPVQDPTNRADGPARTATGEALRRAAVREKVLPVLAQALGQDPRRALARTAEQLRDDNAALDWYAAQTLLRACPALGQALAGVSAAGGLADAAGRDNKPSQSTNDLSTQVLNAQILAALPQKTWKLAVGPLAGVPLAVLRRTLRLAGIGAGALAAEIKNTHLSRCAQLVTNWRGQKEVQLPGARVVRQGGYLVFSSQ